MGKALPRCFYLVAHRWRCHVLARPCWTCGGACKLTSACRLLQCSTWCSHVNSRQAPCMAERASRCRPSPRSETTIHRRCPSLPLRPLQVSTATRIVDIRFAAGPDGAVNDQVGAPRCFQACLKQEHTQALAHLSLLLRQFLVLGTHLAVRNRHHPPQWQYIFALTMDVDGFPGGALWRSDKHGAYDSWADQTQKLAASLPQVRPWREAACRAGRRAATQGLGRPGSLWRGREPQAVLGALQSIAAEPCCKAAAADTHGHPRRAT